jgi:hypothetical protein
VIPRYNIKRIKSRLEGNTSWMDYIPPILDFEEPFDLVAETNKLIEKAYEAGFTVEDIYPGIKDEDQIVYLYPNEQIQYTYPKDLGEARHFFRASVPTPVMVVDFMGTQNYITFYEGDWYLIHEKATALDTLAATRFVRLSDDEPLLQEPREPSMLLFSMFVDMRSFRERGFNIHTNDDSIEFYKYFHADAEPLLHELPVELEEHQIQDIYNSLKEFIEE